MCNPRRVRCRAARKIAEAWRAEIEQAATARGDVTAEARLVQPIADLLPPPALRAFEQAMQASAEWEWTDGEYRQAVPGGHTAYRPDLGELEIVVQLSTEIEATATATVVKEGEVTDEVEAEATGSYYSDGYAGQTKEKAQRRAQAAADAKAEKEAAQRQEWLKAQAEETARYQLKEQTKEAAEQARRSAERQLTEQAVVAQQDLDAQASKRLDEVQDEALRGVFALVAAGYSAALQQYALANGENLQVSEDDGVIEIQFEMEA